MAKTMEELDANPNPWYKEPWPWILMSGPAIVVVACIITIYLAFSTGANEEMGGAVKRGLVIEILRDRSPTDAPAAVDVPQVSTPAAADGSAKVQETPAAAN